MTSPYFLINTSALTVNEWLSYTLNKNIRKHLTDVIHRTVYHDLVDMDCVYTRDSKSLS